MLYAVIMAGGVGTRFWPASRSLLPKQLLDLVGGQSMIQATVARLRQLVPSERVLIVTNVRLVDAIANQLPELSETSVLAEPCKRDTAPCIGLAAIHISSCDEDAIMVVMPSDHVIHTDDQFRQAISGAVELVRQRPGRLVTFGIRPTYAAESFGYIERGEALSDAATDGTYVVRRFREKPDADVARRYLESGDYYWNSGIFVWRAGAILDELRRHEPEMYEHLVSIAEAAGSAHYQQVLEREFAAIDGKSIDYAVMEHAEEVVVVEAPFQWDDVGSWQSIARLRGTDQYGNTVVGNHLGVRTSGTIIRTGEDHLVVTLGLQDCIVVHTEDATLVASKHDEESVRQVVKQLAEQGWDEYL